MYCIFIFIFIIVFYFIILELIFEALTPVISSKSIQLTNGTEGKDRHRIISEALGHDICSQVLPQFIQVGIG